MYQNTPPPPPHPYRNFQQITKIMKVISTEGVLIWLPDRLSTYLYFTVIMTRSYPMSIAITYPQSYSNVLSMFMAFSWVVIVIPTEPAVWRTLVVIR